MPAETVADQHAARQAALARRTARRINELWRRVDRAAIAASWRALLPLALAELAMAQTAAAAAAGLYVDDTLAGIDTRAEGRIAPGAFAGVASDGRPLAGLLYRPVFTALEQIGAGGSPARGMAAGAFSLDLITRTQVADAGRVADGVAITVRPGVSGYVRRIVGKTCSRCLILAGRVYRWNEGFSRHPQCDCRHVPVSGMVPSDLRVDPRAYFDSLDQREQDALLGRAGAEAVREGADIARVVNARRGMQTASVFGRDVLVTTEATTRRGINRRVRLMPEQIYRDARDREDAVRLLRLHGYIL
jgi:hypothetical protein